MDMTRSSQADRMMLSDIKLVRYQQNPLANWGPQARAGKAIPRQIQLEQSALEPADS